MTYGGGHAPDTGRRGTSEFPADWSRDTIMRRVHRHGQAPDPARPTAADLADGRVGHAATELPARLEGRIPDADIATGTELYEAGEWDELGAALAAGLDVGTVDLTQEERAMLATLID